MTNALLNNLNTMIDKTVNLAEKMPKTDNFDFEKIYDAQTNTVDNPNNNQKAQENNTNVYKLRANCEKSVSSNSNNTQTIGNVQNNTNTDNTNLQNITDNNIQENTTDTLNEQNSIQEDTQIINIPVNYTNETENIITEEELNHLEEIILTEEITVTEEEPTMYNELNTLENPATMLLLQAQIQKNIKNCFDIEQSDDLSDENVNIKTNDILINNTALLNKQYENSAAKDINVNLNQFANISPKEITQAKSTTSKVSDVINENIIKELNVEVISAQSSEAEGSFGDLMQNQTPQEQAARVMIQGDIKYETATTDTVKNVQVKPKEITPSKIIEQIYKQLDGMVKNSKISMILNPSSLGKVNLQLMNTKEGLMAQFTVISQDVKDILMKGLEGLKESLLAQGVNVDNVSVKLEETDNEYNPDYTEQENSNSGNRQQNPKQQKENEKTFEELIGISTNEEQNEA